MQHLQKLQGTSKGRALQVWTELEKGKKKRVSTWIAFLNSTSNALLQKHYLGTPGRERNLHLISMRSNVYIYIYISLYQRIDRKIIYPPKHPRGTSNPETYWSSQGHASSSGVHIQLEHLPSPATDRIHESHHCHNRLSHLDRLLAGFVREDAIAISQHLERHLNTDTQREL